jgi:hypothetical protein
MNAVEYATEVQQPCTDQPTGESQLKIALQRLRGGQQSNVDPQAAVARFGSAF